MRDRRSSLESINTGRRRRSATVLDELDSTLDRLEGRFDRSVHEDGYGQQPRLRDIGRDQMHGRMNTAYPDHAYSDLGYAGRAYPERTYPEPATGMRGLHEDTVRSFDRRWSEIDRRFNEMASNLTAPPPAPAATDPALKTLATRIEEIGGVVSALPTSGALRSLEDKMKLLQGAVDRFSHQQEMPGAGVLDAIEERLDELSRAIAISANPPRTAAFDPEPFERLEARISSLARQIGEATQEDATRHLSDQLAALSYRVEDLAQRIDLPEQAIERLAGQIGTIVRRLDHAPALPNLDTVFHGLENRIASIADLLEQRHEDALAHGKALFYNLETRIDDVATRIETERPAAGHDQQLFIAAMDARFAELAAHFERQISAAPRDDSGALRHLEHRLERRLDTISSRIEASGGSTIDTDLIRSLEAQIAGLAEHITRPAAASHEDSQLGPRLDRIEQSLTGSRSDVLEAARYAAEEAVRNFSGTPAEGEMVAALADDLKSLEALTRRSDDRNTRTFEAIHDTLLKVADRLGTIESNKIMATTAPLTAQPPIPAPVREVVLETEDTPSLSPEDELLQPPAVMAEVTEELETQSGRSSLLGGLTRAFSKGSKASAKSAPPADKPVMAERLVGDAAPLVEIDQSFANEPLEPGSGTPDLNAIMRRVRDERSQPARGTGPDASRADFIAAARRAAQAAASEAATAKERQTSSAGKEGAGTASLFKRRRKPLLMGVAAILMALMALQGSRIFLGNGSGVQQAATPAATPAPAQPVRIAGESGKTNDPALSDPAVLNDDTAPQESTSAADDDWLDMDETAAVTPAVTQPEEMAAAPSLQPVTAPNSENAEIEALPEPDEASLAAIPLDAGPVALREAAAAGDARAFFEIGNRYAEGRGVAEDTEIAARWYEKAAGQDLAPAQYRLASFYEKGIGVTRDVAKARQLYERAAEQGNASAMHNLAVLNAMGADGETDNKAAARWFQRAAEFGVRDSQFNLGILAAKGVGMEQNLQEAYKWFALVAKAGDKDAADKRDEIARVLRPEQLETARAAAELWRVKELNTEANTIEIPASWGESQTTTASVDMRAAIRNIQQILNSLGFEAGAEDGVMGQKTKMAIAAFQKDNGMASTGEVDEALVRALLEKR